MIRGDPASVGHIIQASGGAGAARRTINYSTERVVGNGSFGVVFQATCLETGETVSWGLSSCELCLIVCLTPIGRSCSRRGKIAGTGSMRRNPKP